MSLRILLAVWGESGNLAPAMTAARRLREAGHRPRILAAPALRGEVEAAGLPFSAWRRAPPYARPKGNEAGVAPSAIGELCAHVLFGPAEAIARDVLDALREEPADRVVLHDFLLGGVLAAEALDVPAALLSPHVSLRPLPGVPPLGSGLQCGMTREIEAAQAAFTATLEAWLDELNAARLALGLTPVGSVMEQFDRIPRILLAMSPAFDFQGGRLPDNVRYVGPLLDPPGGTADLPVAWPEPRGRARVLVGLGTTFQGQGPLLARVLQALAGTDFSAIATTGPVPQAGLEVPANVSLVHSAPHDLVMPAAAAVVTHGGHGTVSRALIHGRPLLVLPMGRDQDDNAARVAACGAGLVLSPDASAAEIRATLERLIAEPAFAAAAGRLGQALLADSRSATLLREIEELTPPRPAAADREAAA